MPLISFTNGSTVVVDDDFDNTLEELSFKCSSEYCVQSTRGTKEAGTGESCIDSGTMSSDECGSVNKCTWFTVDVVEDEVALCMVVVLSH